MKSFEQYIGEARQDYIFGGTDDRNTETNKPFGELAPGDTMLYYNETVASKPTRLTVVEAKTNKKGALQVICTFDDDYDIVFNVWKGEEDEFYYEHRLLYGSDTFVAYGTDEELFIEKLKRNHNLNFTIDDIKEVNK